MPTQIVHDLRRRDSRFIVLSTPSSYEARSLSNNDTLQRTSTLYFPYYFSVNLCTFYLFYYSVPLQFRIAISRTCYFTWTWQNCFALSCQVTRSKVDGCKHLENSYHESWENIFFFKSMFVKALLFFTSADVVSFLSGRKLAQVEITFDCTWTPEVF